MYNLNFIVLTTCLNKKKKKNQGFPGGLDGKASARNAGDLG